MTFVTPSENFFYSILQIPFLIRKVHISYLTPHEVHPLCRTLFHNVVFPVRCIFLRPNSLTLFLYHLLFLPTPNHFLQILRSKPVKTKQNKITHLKKKTNNKNKKQKEGQPSVSLCKISETSSTHYINLVIFHSDHCKITYSDNFISSSTKKIYLSSLQIDNL